MPAELATSFEDAWERFQAFDSLEFTDDAPALAHGRAQLLGFIVRIEDPSVRRYAASALERLEGITGVEPLPEEHWHMTVKLAGFQVIKQTREDDILRQDVGRVGKAAAQALSERRAYEARIGLPSGFRDGVFLEVRDGNETRELHRTLAERVPGRYPSDGDRFLPHISIARFTSDEGLEQLKKRLAELRAEEPGPPFPIRRVEYVKAWLTEPAPEFETLASLRLATP